MISLRSLQPLAIASVLVVLGVLAAQESKSPSAAADEPADAKAALQKVAFLIGDWRGVGQPRRGSTQGAWQESVGWAWDFSNGKVALVEKVADGKLTGHARLEFDDQAKTYRLALTATDQSEQVYAGKLLNGGLVLEQSPASDKVRRKITLTPRGDIRLIALHEASEPGRDVLFRVAEIGYTREGERLALPGGGQPQCVVTGGLGTTEVKYKGETYYVCCSGCKQAFEEDPEKIIAEYRERIAAERKQVEK